MSRSEFQRAFFDVYDEKTDLWLPRTIHSNLLGKYIRRHFGFCALDGIIVQNVNSLKLRYL